MIWWLCISIIFIHFTQLSGWITASFLLHAVKGLSFHITGDPHLLPITLVPMYHTTTIMQNGLRLSTYTNKTLYC